MKWLCLAVLIPWISYPAKAQSASANNALLVILTTEDISCHGLNDGFATLTLIAGAAPVGVQWLNTSTGNTGNLQLTATAPVVTLSGLQPGAYTFTLTDATGADSTLLGAITDPPQLSGALSILSDYNGFAVSCADSNDGHAQAKVNGGTPPYTYHWPYGESAAEADSLPAGQFNFLVTDAQNCPLVIPLNLSAPPPIVVTLSATGEKCFGENTGAIQLKQVSGGLPPYNISFNGSPALQQTAWDHLAPGNYFIRISDQNHCVQQEGAVLPTGLQFSFSAGPDVDLFSGDSLLLPISSMHAIDTLWASPADVSWSSSDSLVVFPLFSTDYTVTAVDPAGCRTLDQLHVTVHRHRSVFAPNVLYPAATELANRYFTLFDGGGVRNIASLMVFDRLGRPVFDKKDFPAGVPELGWDGRSGGQEAPAGVYLWVASLRYTDGRLEPMQGDVTVLR